MADFWFGAFWFCAGALVGAGVLIGVALKCSPESEGKNDDADWWKRN